MFDVVDMDELQYLDMASMKFWKKNDLIIELSPIQKEA